MQEACEMVRSRWPKPRVARMAFLVGRGEDAVKVAKDPLVQSTPATVHDYVRRMGLAFADVPRGRVCLDLPVKAMAVIEMAAKRRQQTPEAFLKSVAIVCADDPTLFDNVLDDGK